MRDAKKNEPFEQSRYRAIHMMAESFLWRGEIERGDFWQVVTVLEALGYLNDVECAQIQDQLDDIYSKDLGYSAHMNNNAAQNELPL